METFVRGAHLMFPYREKRLITSIISNIGHIRLSLAFNFSHKTIDLGRRNSAGVSVYKRGQNRQPT